MARLLFQIHEWFISSISVYRLSLTRHVCDLSSSCRVAQKREDAVSKEVTRKLSEADNRKMSRKEKDER